MDRRKSRGRPATDPSKKGAGWLVCAVGAVLSGACVAFSAAPVESRWIALGSSEPASAAVQVLESRATGLTVGVTLFGFSLGVHDDANGQFATLSVPGSGSFPVPGSPALPVIRRLIVVPGEAEVSCHATGRLVAISLSALGVPARILPVQAPIPKIPGAVDAAVFMKNAAIYASEGAYPNIPVTLSEAGTLFGFRLLSLEFCPFVMVPATGSLSLYTNVTLAVTFSKGQDLMAGLTAEGSKAAQEVLKGTVLNYPASDEVKAAVAVQKRLLIIAPEGFTNSLAPFITHKTSRGWAVDCFGTNSTGTSSTSIQSFIKNRYANSASRPDALLLVGDVAQIPRFVGGTLDNPDTDLYYGCMDGGTDWIPEFPVGRFSVTSTSQLSAVIAKSISHELSALEPWIKRATFMASKDNYVVSETTHNAVISSTLAPLGFSCEKLYCHSSNAVASQVQNAFNRGCVLGIYSGHGDTQYWADGPYFTRSEVNGLTNAAHYPIVCSFACFTGDYSARECFAETWLRGASRGAVAVLASSVTSYWDEDDILERSFVDAVFKENQPQVGRAIWRAKMLYLGVYGAASSTTQRYFEQYNLFGDPTLEMVGIPILTNGIPEAWFTAQGITNANYNLELQEDRDGDGMTAFQEYLAGTNPRDAASALRLMAGMPGNGGITLRWLSANSLKIPMASYQIEVCSNLTAGVWLPQTNLIIRTPPTNEVQLVAPEGTPHLFYRVTLPD
jgi:hypothetical protein